VFTGSARAKRGAVVQPITGRMLELGQVFWPRWRDCSIVFGNVRKDEPAAASSVAIYELEDLPALAVPGDPQDGSRRTLGIQYEDPCGAANELGATDRREWIERLITYARYTGQSTLAYPIVWYHGPLYPSKREPVNYIGSVSSRHDRQMIIHWTTQPDDWVAELLERFGREQMQFRAVLPIMRLGSLMEKMNVDLESIKTGTDTINNMTFKDQVQMGTYDWTVKYNLRNFQTILDAGGNKFSGSTAWVYGEKSSGPDGFRGPIFNPLHPTVQEALLGLVREVVDRYGRYPAFQGIEVFFWPTTTLWFGSLRSGYDDHTVALFQKETGIVVPVDAKAPDRFSRRYAFLTGEVKPRWVAWRCEKIAHLFRRIRDVSVETRPDLQVTITLPGGHVIGHREAGVDVELMASEPGIQVNRVHYPELPPTGEPRDMAGAFHGIWNFNRWIERWGKHRWVACDPKLREMATIMGKPAEGVMRNSLEYPKDGFWWDQQWRITPVYQSGVNFMQHYAHAVAEYDAQDITRGGLTLDTGHAELIRPFALAYRTLPAKKFETIGGSTDPVAVRTLVCEGKRYLYLVNRHHKPLSVNVQLNKATGKATDLATNQEVEAPAHWPIPLGPYQLRSFGLAPEVEIAGATIPPRPILLAPDNPSGSRNDLARTYGSGFAIVGGKNQLVNMLGVWDQDGDGLATAHDAGLWQLGDGRWDLIASATVPAGTKAPLIDGFRYVPIPETTLRNNRAYRLGALFFKGGDAIQDADLGGGAFSPASGIRYDHSLISESGGALQLPTAGQDGKSGPGRWAGANLIYKP